MKRTSTIKVAVSSDEHCTIREHAEQRGLSVAALLRSAALEQVRRSAGPRLTGSLE